MAVVGGCLDTMSGRPATEAAPRRTARYARSSTVSVGRLLTDSCSSLLQRLTTRVRGPSTATDLEPPLSPRHRRRFTGPTTIHPSRGHSTYLAAADRRKPPPTRDDNSPPDANPLAKSATVVYLSQTPYLVPAPREKTPFRTGARDLQRYKAGKSEARLQPPHKERPLRAPHSEAPPPPTTTLSPTTHKPASSTLPTSPPNEPPSDDQPLSEREAKRKEIQSLIQKYTTSSSTAKDESAAQPTPLSALAKCQQKYSSFLSASIATAATASTSAVAVTSLSPVSCHNLPRPTDSSLIILALGQGMRCWFG